jgi:hypothetical protein
LVKDLKSEATQQLLPEDEKHINEMEVALDQGTPGNGEFAGFPDMPEECIEGYLGDLVRERMPEFPRAFAWGSVITMASALMSDVQGEEEIRSNIFTALVGPVHSGKTQAIERAAKIIDVSYPELIKTYSGSMEQLARQIGDPGGAARVLHVDELAHLFAKAQIDRASFTHILNDLFYSSNVSITMGRKATDKVQLRTRLSLIGGIVEERFEESFARSTTGGTWDRFMFAMCPAKFVYEFHPLKPAAAPPSRPMATRIDRSVWEAHAAILRDNADINPRVLEISERMLLTSFCYSGYKVMRGKDVLDLALPFAKYQMAIREFARPETGLTLDARCGNLITRYCARTRKWMPQRMVKHRTKVVETYGAPMVERVLNALFADGTLAKIKVGKMTMVRYVCADEPEVENEPD